MIPKWDKKQEIVTKRMIMMKMETRILIMVTRLLMAWVAIIRCRWFLDGQN